jgi:hypothetical protein
MWFSKEKNAGNAAADEAEAARLATEKAADAVMDAVYILQQAAHIHGFMSIATESEQGRKAYLNPNGVRVDMVTPMAQHLAAKLDQYVEKAMADGSFRARWPVVLDAIAETSEKVLALQCAEYVFQHSAIAKAVWQKNPGAAIAAQKCELGWRIACALEDVAAFPAQPAPRQVLLTAMNYYAATTLVDQSFKPAWGQMLDYVAGIDPALAAQSARQIFQANSPAHFSSAGDVAFAC